MRPSCTERDGSLARQRPGYVFSRQQADRIPLPSLPNLELSLAIILPTTETKTKIQTSAIKAPVIGQPHR